MESIAPMAKILAESNGIDWRVIQGSGDGGQIVEQDILNYLMRIMNGEEEPPATPVDEPPPDWTGEMPPLPSMEMMAQAGIESDITDFVASTARPTPTPQSVPGTAPLTSDLDQDAMDFELDDDTGIPVDSAPQSPPPAPVSVHATTELAPEPAPAPAESDELRAPLMDEAPMDIAEGAPDSDVELAEPLSASEAAPTQEPWTPAAAQQDSLPEAALPEPTPPQVVTPPAPQAAAPEAPAGQAAGGFALGSLLSRLYKRKDGQPESPAAPAQPQPVQPEVVPQPVAAAPAFEEPALEEPVAALGEAVEPAAPVADSPLSAPLVADQLREEEEAQAQEQVEAAQPEAVEPVATEPEEVHAGAFQPEEALPAAVAPLAEADHEVDPVPAVVPAAPVAAQSLAQRRGAHLRLNVNTAALEQAAAQLSEHLGQQVAAELLVARAAARCLEPLGLSSVAVVDLGDELSPRASAQLHGSDLRAAVAEYHAGEPGDWAELMVLDAGALGLDELHLTGDLTTLSLGQRDGGQAALTLSGGVSPLSGAAFLKQVAELLQTPIKLLF